MKRPLSPRAKKNMRVLKYIHLAVFGVAVVLPLGLDFACQRGLREIKRQMRAEGLPLTPTELNRPLPPADQNAAPIYRQLTELLEKHPLNGDDTVLNDVVKQVPPSPEHIARLRAALGRRQDITTLIREAAQKPDCVFNRDYSLGPDVQFPEYAKMRVGLRVLTNESIVLLADGKVADAIRNETLGFRIAQHSASDPTLIGKLVGVALNSISLRFMERVLYTAGDQPGIAQAVEDVIARNYHTVSMTDGMRGEIVFGEVTFDMLRAGKAHLDKKEGLQANSGSRASSPLGRAILDANELNLLTCQRENLHLMTRSYTQGKASLDELNRAAQAYAYLPTRSMAAILMPVFGQARTKQAQGEAQAAVVRMAASLFAYHAQHKAFPYSWEQNTSAFPTDPFSGQSLNYRREGTGFAAYSVGQTGRFDGGTADRRPDSYETVFRYPLPAYYTQSMSQSNTASSPNP